MNVDYPGGRIIAKNLRKCTTGPEVLGQYSVHFFPFWIRYRRKGILVCLREIEREITRCYEFLGLASAIFIGELLLENRITPVEEYYQVNPV